MLGQNNTTHYSSPVQVPGTTWSSASTYGDAGLSTKTDGTLWAWGTNAYGAIGQNNRTQYSSPVQIPGTTWSKVSAGAQPKAIKTDGTLWSWGYQYYGQGNNTRLNLSSPVQVPGTDWYSVSAQSAWYFAITRTS